jgi:hypothetical protein
MNMHVRHLPIPAISIDDSRYVDAFFRCSDPWKVAHSCAWGSAGLGDGMTSSAMWFTSMSTGA